MKMKGTINWSKAIEVVTLLLMICVLCITFIAVGFSLCHDKYYNNIEEELTIEETVPAFYALSPEEGLKEALIYYNVDYPDIVYSQAILETGNFKSRVCYEYNNLFGLYNSRKGDYFRFNHWVESVVAYRDMIQGGHRYEEHYYDYLKKIGYAEDKDYSNKVKKIANETRDQGRYSARDTIP